MDQQTITTIKDVLTLFVSIAVPVIGAWNLRQRTRINDLETQGQEDRKSHAEERNQDRMDRQELRESISYWQGLYSTLGIEFKKLQQDKADTEKSYVALSTRHEELRSSYDGSTHELRELNVRFEKKVTELDQLRADMSTATRTIENLQSALVSERTTHDDQLTRLNDDAMRQKSELQSQIDKLTEDLGRANASIVELRRKIEEFNDANMQLADLNDKLARQIEQLIGEKAQLIAEKRQLEAQLAATKVPIQLPEPTPPAGAIDPDTGDAKKVA